MKAFGSGSMKRTMFITNCRSLGHLGSAKARRKRGTKRLCRKYLDSKGRPAFAGTKALKLSQTLVYSNLYILKKYIEGVQHEGSPHCFSFGAPLFDMFGVSPLLRHTPPLSKPFAGKFDGWSGDNLNL